MPLLKNPNELNDDFKYAGLVYGQPGVGKTTLIISGPTSVLIDADRGMKRVKKRFQVPSLPMDNYEDFLALLAGHELDPFESICIDTLGRFIERMADFLMEKNPKLRQGAGSLTMKGYGSVKSEFQRVIRVVKDKNKHLFFGAHEKEEKENDGRYMRPDSPGSAGKDLVKDLDFLGYMEMNGTRRTISFSPTDKYYAKNSLELDAVIEVPNPEKVGNTFLQKYIIERAVQVRAAGAVENKKYEDLVADGAAQISTAATSTDLDALLTHINAKPVIWDSTRQLKRMLNDRAIALGFAYDKVAKKFVKPAPQTQAEADKVLADAAKAPVAGENVTLPEAVAGTTVTLRAAAGPKPTGVKVTKSDMLATALINGIEECKTVGEIDAYLQKQSADIAELDTHAPISVRAKIAETIAVKKQQLTSDSVHKAA